MSLTTDDVEIFDEPPRDGGLDPYEGVYTDPKAWQERHRRAAEATIRHRLEKESGGTRKTEGVKRLVYEALNEADLAVEDDTAGISWEERHLRKKDLHRLSNLRKVLSPCKS